MSNVYSVLNERMTRKNDLDMKCAYAYACALTGNIYTSPQWSIHFKKSFFYVKVNM